MELGRVERDWNSFTKPEKVVVEFIANGVYGFTSELGALRLFHKYRYSGDKARIGYSENLETWFFVLDRS